MSTPEKTESLNFLEQIIEDDIESGVYGGKVITRFPPEPNGYLHVGHAKAICISFGMAKKYGGKTHLRFDDTNPVTEDTEYVDSIMADVKWLGFEWEGEELYTSDYFDQLYGFAVTLIKEGKAFVDDSSLEEIRRMRGVPTSPGEESPFRNRPVEENLDLLDRMKNGEFEEGSRVLRAKVDMTSPNMHMRDPILYRILKASHHRTGDKWSIYPMYDWAHGQSDAIEGITHSLCSLEFEVHRPLYDWFLDQLEGEFASRPKQREFSRLNVDYTVTSKRKLRELVEANIVNGWDDPRMPTISAMRRRGYPAESLVQFCDDIGVTKRAQIIDLSRLENSVRNRLNTITPRVMGVLDPLKVVITNYPEGKTEMLSIINNPGDPEGGSREVPFSREIYVERDDFMEDPPKKYFRLFPGAMVRLKGAYIIKCDDFVKNPETGEVTELHCTYFPESKSGEDNSGLKAKGVLHFVSIAEAIEVEVRLYDRLFSDPDPTGHDKDFKEFLNPDSLTILDKVYVEPSLATAQAGDKFQFMRKGYFAVDPDSSSDKLVFNRTVTLRDGWGKR